MGAKIRVRRDEAGSALAVSFEGERDINLLDTSGNLVAPIQSTVAPRLTYLADPSPPGACTISHPSGRAAIALGTASVVITNTLVTTATICIIIPLENDATLVTWKAVCTSNTITVTGGATATADWPFQFVLVQGVEP